MLTSFWVCTTVIFIPTNQPVKSGNLAMKPQLILHNKEGNQWWTNPGPLLRAQANQKYNRKPLTRKQAENLNVMITSYDLGITVLAVAEAISQQDNFHILNPTLAYYNTNVYRWIKRLLSLYPDLTYGKFIELHKVWRRRFHHEGSFIPGWLKHVLTWVDNDSWDKEKNASLRYDEYARHVFDRYHRYPPQKFNSEESFSNSTSIFYPGPPDDEF